MINTTNCDEYAPSTQTATSVLNALAATSTPSAEWNDQQLVQACLTGDESAWGVLIRRYQNVMYFFARRYGASASDAADVFQLVCAELFVSLPRLRNQRSLRSWIMTVSAHQAYHWKRSYLKRAQREGADPEVAFVSLSTPPSTELEQTQRDEIMRSAIRQLPPRCQELVRLLFYEDPPLPYETVAVRLGLATGSIGLTRSRCLKKLERILDDAGVRASDRGRSAATWCAGRVHDAGCETH
jgi:RNA polymerase sigma factor (sigma-70 family)